MVDCQRTSFSAANELHKIDDPIDDTDAARNETNTVINLHNVFCCFVFAFIPFDVCAAAADALVHLLWIF